ncbi:hypothetical protein ACFQ3N_15730 [Virgibacillus byunsanensis]|uniref:Lipoprotein n=1 Tax=Virgibacillus byunsanensis TaxID=570945 RepID=A0ABW3LR44_9BACI
MRKMIGILLLVVMMFGMTSCSSEAMNNDDVKTFVKEYKTEQYTIENPDDPLTGLEIGEKVKPFLSEEELENLMKNRVFSIAPTIAKNIGKSVELEGVRLEKEQENDNGSIDYTYTLKLKYYDDHSSVVVAKKGELTIKNNDGLKITRDWEKPTEFEQYAILQSH